jgi:hypothetical protein
VFGVDTPGVAAQVVDDQSLRDLTNVAFICPAMSTPVLLLAVEDAVATGSCVAVPHPAANRVDAVVTFKAV